MGIFTAKTNEQKEEEKKAKEAKKLAKAEAREAKIAAEEAAKEERATLYKSVQEESECAINQGFRDPVLYLTPTGIKNIKDGELNTIAIEDIQNYEHIPTTLTSYLKVPGGFYEPRHDKDDERIEIITKSYKIYTIKISKQNKTNKIKIISYLKSHGIESI